MDYKRLIQHNSNLHEHQIEAKGKIFEAWEKYDAVMLQMPTGTGKTYLFTSIVNDLVSAYKESHQDVHILIVAHRTELLDQISSTLNRFGIPHGFIQGSREQHLWKRVQVGSIMSLLTERNHYHIQRQKFDYIIVDEAHHSLADTYVELFGMFPGAKKLGVTATPWRLNHESFLKLYQTLITSPQISWFIERRLLADFDYVSIKPDSEIQRLVNNSEISTTGDFSNSDLDNVFNTQRIRSKVFDSYKRFADGRKGIIYTINKLHATKIAELYCSRGVEAVAIDCDTPKEERQELIEKFKKGIIKVLVNVEIFTEGFDCPDVSFIQLARPTRSLALYLQQVGRGLRMVVGKEKTIIIDNVGLYNYFGLPDANRKWQHHFIGREDAEHPSHQGKLKCALEDGDYMFDVSRLEEADEEMMVVRGAVPEGNHHEEEAHESDSDVLTKKEFYFSDYYYVYGNRMSFDIFPIVKKKGKATCAIGNCVYSYNGLKQQIVFGSEKEQNMQLLESDAKLYTIIQFSAMLLHIEMVEIFDLNRLCRMSHSVIKQTVDIFEVLEMMSKIRK